MFFLKKNLINFLAEFFLTKINLLCLKICDNFFVFSYFFPRPTTQQKTTNYSAGPVSGQYDKTNNSICSKLCTGKWTALVSWSNATIPQAPGVWDNCSKFMSFCVTLQFILGSFDSKLFYTVIHIIYKIDKVIIVVNYKHV